MPIEKLIRYSTLNKKFIVRTVTYLKIAVVKVTVISKEHCNEKPSYVFPEKELLGLSPNFHIHVPVSDLYIPRIGPQISLHKNRQIDCGNV
jgi:hypothetical protein